MSGFPLYDNLIKDLPKKDLSVKDKEKFIKNIKLVNINGLELIYALILVYHEQNEKVLNSSVVPYKGFRIDQDNGTSNFCWVYTHFPVRLRHILFRFVKIHLEKEAEEKQRSIQSL